MIFIFDIDDTLYDLEDPFRFAFTDMFGYEPENIHNIFLDFRKYNNKVYEKAILGEITMEEMCIYRAKNALGDHGIEIDDKQALLFQLTYLKDKENIRLNPYMEKALNLLKKNNIPMGIISNGPHKEQFQKVNYLGIEKYIDSNNIFISEDVGFHKPKKEIFSIAKRELLNRFKLSDECDVFYIGDSFSVDMVGAKKAQMKTVWANHRHYNVKKGDFTPDFEASSFEEVYEIIKKLIS